MMPKINFLERNYVSIGKNIYICNYMQVKIIELMSLLRESVQWASIDSSLFDEKLTRRYSVQRLRARFWGSIPE